MELTWLGDACFRLRNRESTILIEPPSGTGAGSRSLGEADIVAVSDERARESAIGAVQGSPRFVGGPGEYEIAGVLITGVRTSPAGKPGAALPRNTSYVIEMDEVRVCYLGRLDHVLSPDQVEELNGAEVLIVPVGGRGLLDAAAAAEVISLLEPRIIVPMHYRLDGADAEQDPLDRFLKQMGVGEPQAVARLVVTKTNLPLETTVTLLESRR